MVLLILQLANIILQTVLAWEYGRNNYFAGKEQKTGEELDESWVTYLGIYRGVPF